MHFFSIVAGDQLTYLRFVLSNHSLFLCQYNHYLLAVTFKGVHKSKQLTLFNQVLLYLDQWEIKQKKEWSMREERKQKFPPSSTVSNEKFTS